MVDGRLFYLVGPSGSGKDSLIRYARERLAGNPRIVFAHRYITRPVEQHGENHIALTEHEFDSRLIAGLFTMHWSSHGLRYGIGLEIDLWLSRGCYVVMNGSRAYLNEARRRYPGLIPVQVIVNLQILEARLRERGRESDIQIKQRLDRARYDMCADGPVKFIENNTDLHVAGEQLVALLETPTEVFA
jgi:ribose 1,5-bisphosphokinase